MARSQPPSWLLFRRRDPIPSRQRFLRYFSNCTIFLLQMLVNVISNIQQLFLLYTQPDITAPGVSVIAAYTKAQGPTNQDFDTRRVLFNSVSGTSMSCPHVSGIVGLLKTLHPTWSPASIKSAIMTTGECICKLSEL